MALNYTQGDHDQQLENELLLHYGSSVGWWWADTVRDVDKMLFSCYCTTLY